ncbi:MAG: biotin/lipoyl-containing protein [Acidobacteriota bacterium]
MIRLKAEVSGRQHEVIFQRREQMLSAEVDGRHYEIQVRDLAAGEYLLGNGTRIYDCRVETNSQQPEILGVNIHGRSFGIRLIDPKRLRGRQTDGEVAGSAQIIAPMPGKVVRVLVEVGTQIDIGAGVVVVEAMKMQNEMKSPKAGVVVSLNAEIGATVNAGDVLAVIE